MIVAHDVLKGVEAHADVLRCARSELAVTRREVEPLVCLAKSVAEEEVRHLVERTQESELAGRDICRGEETADVVLSGCLTAKHISRSVRQRVLHVSKHTLRCTELAYLHLVDLLRRLSCHIRQPKIRTARRHVVVSRAVDRHALAAADVTEARENLAVLVDEADGGEGSYPEALAVGVVATVGYFEVGLVLYGYDSHDATVVEVELEETVRPVATVEVASVVRDVVELIVHLGDAELLYEAPVLIVLPELAKLDR